MEEYTRIIIEDYCAKYKTDPRFQKLAKLVKRSYKLDAEYTSDAEANREEFIHCHGGLKQEWNFDIYRQAFYRYNCDKRSF